MRGTTMELGELLRHIVHALSKIVERCPGLVRAIGRFLFLIWLLIWSVIWPVHIHLVWQPPPQKT
jgi:hypothetical protein